jgi:hypothetical protein
LIVFYGQSPKGAGIYTHRTGSTFISINFNSQAVTSWILFNYRNSGHDTKLNTLTANIATFFNIGLAMFHGQQTFGAILVTNGAPAAFFGINQYFRSLDFIHKINFKL